MYSAWRGQDSRPGGRWVNVDELKTVNEKPPTSAETDASFAKKLEDIMKTREDLYNIIRAKSRAFSNVWSDTDAVSKSSTASAPVVSSTSSGTASSVQYDSQPRNRKSQQRDSKVEPEYRIDPITNRRIPSQSSPSSKEAKPQSSETPDKTFRNYRSQFQGFEPTSLKSESQSSTAPRSQDTIPEYLKEYEQEHPYGTHVYSTSSGSNMELDGHDPVQEGLKDYDEKVDYESGHYDCKGIAVDYSDPVQNGLKDYDSKISTGKFSTKPIVKVDEAERCGLAEYDAKAGCRSGKEQVDPVSQAIKDYESRSERPTVVKVSNSMSRPIDPVEQAMKEYEKCDTSRQARKRKHAESLLKSIRDYETNWPNGVLSGSMTRRPDMEMLNPVLKAIEEYANTKTDDHSSVRKQEPLDPILKAFEEYKSNQTRDFRRTPFQLVELLDSIRQHKSAILRVANEKVEAPEKCPVQEGLKDYDAKVNYYSRSLPSINSTCTAATGSPSLDTRYKPIVSDTAEDLDLLRTSDVRAASGIVKNPVKESEAAKIAKREALERSFLQNSEAAFAEEAAATEKVKNTRKLAEDLKLEHSYLMNHNAHARGRVDAKLAEVEAGWQPAVIPKKLTGNFVRDFPEEFQTKWSAAEDGSASLSAKSDCDSLSEHVETVPSKEAYTRNPGTPRLETSLDRAFAKRTEAASPAQASVASESKTEPSSHASSSAMSENDAASQAARLADAAARNVKRSEHSSLVREIRGIYEDGYGSIDTKHRQVPKAESTTQAAAQAGETSSPAPAPEPTLYKILAYDPTMQSVSTAETTSIVPDASDSLTPAEVLLRLSNPSKFFPHFAALQAQGYEIVAGSGDVLVFRKVRSASPILTDGRSGVESKLPPGFTGVQGHSGPMYINGSRADALKSAPSQTQRPITNPIDGMQSTPRAATGDYASPTGFVNYDSHLYSSSSPDSLSEPPFKSNIDVRREEPVFSGRRNWEDEEPKKGKRRGRGRKVLVGAAWLAGCSYAVGVVAEFFRTGGVDGKGPVGF